MTEYLTIPRSKLGWGLFLMLVCGFVIGLGIGYLTWGTP